MKYKVLFTIILLIFFKTVFANQAVHSIAGIHKLSLKVDSLNPIVKVVDKFQYKEATLKNHIAITIKVLDGSNKNIPLTDCVWSILDLSKNRLLSSNFNNYGEASIDIQDIKNIAFLRVANLYYNMGTDIKLEDFKGSFVKIEVTLFKKVVKFED